MAKTKEKDFEDAIEASLLAYGGFTKGDPKRYRADVALFPDDLFAFVREHQPKPWSALEKTHGAALEGRVLDALVKALDTRGTLHVLRHGFKFQGALLRCAAFRPTSGLNPGVLAAYAKNRLTVTRQVRFDGSNDSVDVVLSLNGFPLVTLELKNPFTRQSVEHALKQYMDRNANALLFRFKQRALVHFAVDPELVFMTTRLAGANTVFLPFNRGRDGGAGNADHPTGHRTAYLWEQVLQRDSLLDLVGRFIHLEKKEVEEDGKKVTKETIVFPRYHQLDVVRKLETAARTEGAGRSYLVQHSAGSGKSNSIAWLAHRLATLHNPDDERVFHSVVVMTDRKILDKQLQETVFQFEHKEGFVEKIDQNSTQLGKALTAGTPIIITTLQKFPFVTGKIEKLPKRRYAIVVDEAHSSQSGEAAQKMKELLGSGAANAPDEEVEEPVDGADRVAETMLSRGRQKNLSFFAFTATPKAKTLEVFGHVGEDGKPAPFHLYSMRQAIEEGFILDVLTHYTTYKLYFELQKKVADDPEVRKKQAVKELTRAALLHPHNISQKTEIITVHFREKVRKLIGGHAKGMVVTASRLMAVRYYHAFKKYLEDNRIDDVGVLVAFSGTVKDPDTGLEHTEAGLNGFGETQLPRRFAGDAYQLLLVANKYQTGFDQPQLVAMYVDRRLANVQAVQTLSRLNRTFPGKEATFVLDFVNDTDGIYQAFKPFYEQTSVAERADPQTLYDLQHRLVDAKVFYVEEVERFAKIFYASKARSREKEHAELYRCLDPALDRFKGKSEDDRDEFANALAGFVRLYGFLSQVMPFTDADLEKLYSFARYLDTRLPHGRGREPANVAKDVGLKAYRLQKTSEGSIQLRVGEPPPLKSPYAVGTRQAKDERAKLSSIIEVLNERFGTTFTESDQLLFEQWVEDAKRDEMVRKRARANAFDHFSLSIRDLIDGIVASRLDQNAAIGARYFNDETFQATAFQELARRIYDGIRAEAPVGNSPH
ncbi:type I restriction endonuclease subunit R [Sorangium sp. So ce1153]|uniref:type I restriction endonuclease subunit R n=1 Tax=Sorangium sp. So ce1153 TaxID=3133333 RepID=UPI003F5EA634